MTREGELIFCGREDTYLCFMRTDMEALVMGNCLLREEEQPPLQADSDWRSEFQLD